MGGEGVEEKTGVHRVTRERLTREEFLKRGAVFSVAAAGGLGVLGACGVSTTGGGGAQGGAPDTLETARQQGFIRVGFANEAPYGYADESGNLTGEAPEVARKVMKAMGIDELQGVLTEFNSLIPGLQANRFDIIAAGMFITPERCQEILFSDPDYCGLEALAVEEGNPLNLNDYQDVASNPDAKLGVLGGAVEGGYARESGVKESQIVTFPDPSSGIEGLQAGRVDAFTLTSISLRDLIEKREGANLELAKPFTPVIDGEPQRGCGAYGFRKKDEKFRDAFNKKLKELKEGGEILSTIKPFGFTKAEANAAKDVTAEELC
jgi:polar amino acid transport system substrate-binding protein